MLSSFGAPFLVMPLEEYKDPTAETRTSELATTHEQSRAAQAQSLPCAIVGTHLTHSYLAPRTV